MTGLTGIISDHKTSPTASPHTSIMLKPSVITALCHAAGFRLTSLNIIVKDHGNGDGLLRLLYHVYHCRGHQPLWLRLNLKGSIGNHTPNDVCGLRECTSVCFHGSFHRTQGFDLAFMDGRSLKA